MSQILPAVAAALPVGLIGGIVGALGYSMIDTTPMTAPSGASSGGVSEAAMLKMEQRLELAQTEIAYLRTKIDTGSASSGDDANAAAIRGFLMENPDLVFMDVLEQFQANEHLYSARRFAKVLNNGLRDPLFHDASDPMMGNPDGDVVMVEFFDYNCGYCKRAAPDLFKVVEQDSNVKLVFKELPILSASSTTAAQAALASQIQGKYQEFHSALIQYQGRISDTIVYRVAEQVGLDVAKLKQDMRSETVAKKLRETSQLAKSLGVSGTPAFIVGEQFMPGAVPASTLRQAIATTRAVQNAEQAQEG